jgi:hypothetical protein
MHCPLELQLLPAPQLPSVAVQSAVHELFVLQYWPPLQDANIEQGAPQVSTDSQGLTWLSRLVPVQPTAARLPSNESAAAPNSAFFKGRFDRRVIAVSAVIKR